MISPENKEFKHRDYKKLPGRLQTFCSISFAWPADSAGRQHAGETTRLKMAEMISEQESKNSGYQVPGYRVRPV
ncbi:MAG TPA: hypothetical protein DCR87_03580 [Acidobacteria bacterium]|nr:hypothetical protein [Acidobacteriota bacterium]